MSIRTCTPLFLILLMLTFSSSSIGQDVKNHDLTNSSFGKGLINKYAQDSSWYAKVAFRFQTQYEGIYSEQEAGSETPSYTDRFRVRRARIKGDGWATKSKKWAYKFEYDVHNGFVLDAVIKYHFAPNWQVWFGQTKLPGNMERVISSQKLQFVDRSLLNSRFTLDRDAGVQIHHKDKIGSDFIIIEKFAFSQGEGLNQTGRSSGYSYTGRLELLPFGTFKNYVSSSFKRTKTPKLMLGFVYDYNADALRSRGYKGDYLSASRNLETVFVDAHFKYKGISFMGEYANRRTTDASPVVAFTAQNGLLAIDESFYTGSSVNAQIGYLFKNNWELATRFTTVNPEAVTGNLGQDQFSLGFSKYIVGHNLKIQGDISISEFEDGTNQTMFRLQTEFNF